jgi:hypothetical protein
LGGNGARVFWVPLSTISNLPGNTKTASPNAFVAFFLKRKYSTGTKTYAVEFLDLAPTSARTETFGQLKARFAQ